jgi:hypothetical protein
MKAGPRKGKSRPRMFFLLRPSSTSLAVEMVLKSAGLTICSGCSFLAFLELYAILCLNYYLLFNLFGHNPDLCSLVVAQGDQGPANPVGARFTEEIFQLRVNLSSRCQAQVQKAPAGKALDRLVQDDDQDDIRSRHRTKYIFPGWIRGCGWSVRGAGRQPGFAQMQ